MSTEQSIWQGVIEALRLYVKPVEKAVEKGPSGIIQLLGSEAAPATVDALNRLATATSAIADEQSQGARSPEDIWNLVGSLLEALGDLSANLGEDVLLPLFEKLSLLFIWNVNPAIYTVLVLIGVIDESQAQANRVQWQKLENFWHPREMMREEYGWGTENFDGDVFLRRVANVVAAFGAPAMFMAPKIEMLQFIDANADTTAPPTVLLVPIIRRIIQDQTFVFGFEAMPINEAGNVANSGIAVSPIGNAEFEWPLGPLWSVIFGITGDIAHAVIFRPSGVTLKKLPSGSERVDIGVGLVRTASDPWILDLGGGFQIRYATVEVGVDVKVGEPGSFDAHLRVDGFEISIKPEKFDGFLASILPKEGVSGHSDFTIEWSPEEGFQFTGSAGFETHIPLHLRLGPIELLELGLGATIGDSPILSLLATLDVGAEFGPLQVSVSKIGIISGLNLSSPNGLDGDDSGQFGPLGVDIRFHPPIGAGVALVNAGPITGGGFVSFDPVNERYAGILALSLWEISIVAIGIITTKIDGRKAVSILISISIEFDPPIELSMGFTFSGAGGLVGINRAMVLEELQKGIRKNTLDSILFPDPKKVVGNAQQIIDDMRRVFPPHEGRFVVGPMLKFGWGSPNVIQAEVGVFISLPEPIEIALLGKVHAAFPTPDEDIIRINMHVLGTLSFAKKELTFQSSIYDSSILVFTIFGDVAALLRWGNQPEFTLAVGGFHPRFPVPPPPRIFADLKRMGVSVSYGSEIFLMLQGYQALTPNSLQFGARVTIIVDIDVVSAYGDFGFDALFYFNPFSFEISADATININVLGARLIDAKIDLHLSGPTPWNARGNASIHILFFDVDASFDVTWGDTKLDFTPAVDPLNTFLDALQENHNWSARLPNSRGMVVALHPMASDDDLVVHPAGSLEVRQTVLPLGVTLEKFGNAPIAGHDKFRIESFKIGTTETETPKIFVKEHFTRSAFEKGWSKTARLTKPSFEKMTAGIRFSSDPIKFEGDPAIAESGYESVYVTEEELPSDPESGSVDWQDAEYLVAGSASAQSAYLNGGMQRFKETNMMPKVTVSEDRYVIVNIADFTRDSLSDELDEDGSLWHAEHVLEEYLEIHPDRVGELKVVAEYELS